MARSSFRVLVLSLTILGATQVGLAGAATRAGSNAGSPAAGRVLGGVSKGQNEPVVVFVSKNTKRVGLLYDLDMTCTSGSTFTVEEGWPALAVARSGGVRSASAIPPYPASNVTGGSHSLSGGLDRRHAVFTAVAELHLDYVFPNGQTDSCDSGRVVLVAVL
ncbi:MAG: hypothetical protein JO244_08350 [Solirubrobacterales bacterium]|nr:hypothetical protein [Solirubrobacterales bacterium]